jgi:serine/threonine protein kinase
MEFASFGSLNRILNVKGKISERFAASIFRQIIQAISYLHQNRTVHHDIKPMNILLTEKGKAKISDFGMSSSFESAENFYASAAYQAPEIFDGDYCDDLHSPQFDASKIDVWSLGVSLFESVFGILPFQGDDIFQIISSIQSHPLSFPFDCSNEFQDLLQQMLAVNPLKRISINELLHHPFFLLDDDCDCDFGEQIFIPEIDLTQKIKKNSAIIFTHDILDNLIINFHPNPSMNNFS